MRRPRLHLSGVALLIFSRRCPRIICPLRIITQAPEEANPGGGRWHRMVTVMGTYKKQGNSQIVLLFAKSHIYPDF